MKTKNLLSFFLIFSISVNVFAQNKTSQNPKTEKPVLEIPDLPNVNIKNEDSIITSIKEELTEAYHQTEKYKKNLQDNSVKKRILGVGWFDSEFNKVSSTILGEKISIIVLTKGYEMGDEVKVTIDSEDGESLLISETKCNEVTFLGNVNYENLAVLKGIFTVQGEKEQLMIEPEWKNRYICK